MTTQPGLNDIAHPHSLLLAKFHNQRGGTAPCQFHVACLFQKNSIRIASAAKFLRALRSDSPVSVASMCHFVYGSIRNYLWTSKRKSEKPNIDTNDRADDGDR